MSKCKRCGIEFKAKRDDAVLCSVKCRMKLYRSNLKVKHVTDKPKIVTDKASEIVTDKNIKEPRFYEPEIVYELAD